MIVDKLEDLPGYAGVLGEVATGDCYKLRELDFTPDVIFDLGANVGVFARHARELFPKVFLVCVEPDEDNYANLLKFAPGGHCQLIHAAVGSRGKLWKSTEAPDGSHGCFLSAGLGYPAEEMQAEEGKTVELSDIPVVTLPDLIYEWAEPGERVLVKMDIEGNEHTVLTDTESIKLLRRCDYVAIEVHKYALHGGVKPAADAAIDRTLKLFDYTHDVSWEHVHFFARKRA